MCARQTSSPTRGLSLRLCRAGELTSETPHIERHGCQSNIPEASQSRGTEIETNRNVRCEEQKRHRGQEDLRLENVQQAIVELSFVFNGRFAAPRPFSPSPRWESRGRGTTQRFAQRSPRSPYGAVSFRRRGWKLAHGVERLHFQRGCGTVCVDRNSHQEPDKQHRHPTSYDKRQLHALTRVGQCSYFFLNSDSVHLQVHLMLVLHYVRCVAGIAYRKQVHPDQHHRQQPSNIVEHRDTTH